MKQTNRHGTEFINSQSIWFFKGNLNGNKMISVILDELKISERKFEKIHGHYQIEMSFKSIKGQFINIQLIFENSNTQYLEVFDSSDKFFSPLNIAHFFMQKNSRYLESRYLEFFAYAAQLFWSLEQFSVVISNFFQNSNFFCIFSSQINIF